MNITHTDKQREKDPLGFLCLTALHEYLLLFSESLVSKKHPLEMHVMVGNNGINISGAKLK